MTQPTNAQGKVVDKSNNPQLQDRQAAIVSLTDNTGGTANDTLENLADATTWANDHASVENNFADLAAKIEEILAVLRLHGLIAD